MYLRKHSVAVISKFSRLLASDSLRLPRELHKQFFLRETEPIGERRDSGEQTYWLIGTTVVQKAETREALGKKSEDRGLEDPFFPSSWGNGMRK